MKCLTSWRVADVIVMIHMLAAPILLAAEEIDVGAKTSIEAKNCAFQDVFARKQARAPINPAYIQYLRRDDVPHIEAIRTPVRIATKSAESVYSSSVVKQRGYVPSIIDYHYLTNQAHKSGSEGVRGTVSVIKYPETYSLRDLGYVTPVRNQNPYGTCWAHASLASLESNLKRDASSVYDFSVKHMVKWSGSDLAKSFAGANADISTAYLVGWRGPIAEAEDPYPDRSYQNIEDQIPPSPVGTVLGHVQSVIRHVPMTSGLDAIVLKEAIYDHGGAYVSYRDWDNAYSSANKAYYWDGDEEIGGGEGGHAVMLVGWDDNFAASKFSSSPSGKTPPGNGAFLVKGSWGTNYGDGGYYWISYYDYEFGKQEVYSFRSLEPIDNYQKKYEHDPLGHVLDVWVNEGNHKKATAANMFTATSDDRLDAVGVYLPEAGTSYAISIRTGCAVGDPGSGTQQCSVSGVAECAGYFTIKLNTPVSVSAGMRFAVVVTLNCPTYDYPVPVEYFWHYYRDNEKHEFLFYGKNAAGRAYYYKNGDTATYGNDPRYLYYQVVEGGDWYCWDRASGPNGTYYKSATAMTLCTLYSDAAASAGESFVYVNEKTWIDTTQYVDETANFCCKVYANPKTRIASRQPSSVFGELLEDGGKVNLTWQHSDSDATYYIYRSEQNSVPATVHDTVTGVKSYVDTKNLVRGKTYYYWVSAKSAGDEYAESEKVAFGPVIIPVKLAKPVLAPSSTEFKDSLTVSCSCSVSGATIRYTVDGSAPTATSAVWPTGGLKIDQTTTVKVRAFKDGSEESDVTAATYTKLIPPNAPTNFKVTVTDSLSLSWNAVSGAEKYRIYRNTSNTRPTGKPYKEISVRSLTDEGAVPGITYWYWVAAVGSNGLESDWVGPQSGTVAVLLELDQIEKTFSAQGGNGNLGITANVDWAVSCSPWIIPSCRNGSGSAMLGYTVEPTDDVTDRPGIIRISSASDSRYYVELAVTQAGKKPIAALGVAVGNTDLSFWTGGNAMWTAVTTADSFASEGTYVRSGQIVAGQSSHVETIVNGAGTLKFRYAPSKVLASGKLVVLIDGTEWFWTTFGNDDSWKTKSISVPGVGDHRIRWEYRLEQSDSSYVKLDNVEFGEAFRPSVPVPGSVSETDHLVVLMWNLEEEWEMGTRYRIYRGTSLAGPRDCIAEETVSTSSSFLRSFVRYEDATGLPGVAYYYWLEGANESGTVVSAAVQGMKPDTGRPDNDDFDYAGKLEGIGGTAVGTTVKATLEQTPQWTEQPMQSNGKGANTIWWTLSAPMKGVLELDFSQSDVAVVFEVYKKPSGWDVISIPGTHNETLLWAEKDGQTQGCQVSVDAYATYIIRVAGFNDAQGTVRMDWSVSLPQAKVWYVNGSAGKDSNDGLSRQTAKQTIQAAVNGADEGDTVLVAAGVYAAFSAAAANEITIRSEDGPAVTVIDGADASICANLGDIQSESGGLVIIPSIGGGETSHVNTLVGFTVRNGYAQNGGGVYGGIVRNCIVSNNFARSYGGGTYGSSLANCLVVGNEATSKAGGVYGGIVRNCTIVYNRAGAYGGLYMSSPMANDGGTCRNSIVWGNENLDGEVSNYSSSEAMFDCCSSPANKYYSFGMGGLIVDQDPLLNSSSGFYEPAQDSPCIDAGDDEYAPDGLDLRGNERIVSGGVDIGAIESQYVPPPVYVQVSFDANGGSGNMAPQTFVVGEAQPLTHNAFTKSGCFFQGWSKLPTASFATYADGQVVTIERESVWKLYAIWGTAPAPDDPTPVVRRPDNDDFASAIAIEGAEGTTMGLTIGATLEPNERKMTDDPFGINIGIGVVQTPLPTNTIWWTWTAPFTGTMTVDFSGSDIDVAFDVFRTTSLPEDSFMGGGPLASSYGGTDLVRRFAVTSGKCYYIRAAGFANAGGFVTFKWRLKNETWFVNATSGDDANDGLTRAKAKRTIQAAIDDAGSGDTIIVADGVYGAFSAESVNAVTIQSENGPAATVVDGDGQMSCANLGDIRSAGATIVPPTIGGEATPHVNTLIGFTLRNGNADRGGGIYGGIVRNCIVSNNFAHVYGGGTYGSELINCLVVGNMTTNVAGGVYGGGEIRNCTIVFNAAKRHGGLYLDNPISLNTGAGRCRNSIIWGNEDLDGESSNYSDDDALFDCCSYPGRPSYSYGSLGTGGKIISSDPLLNLTSGLYEPMAGSPCIDAGDDAAVTTDEDLVGNARIIGEAVDIGAVECQEILPDMVTVWFDANGGDPEMQSKSYVPGMHYGVFPDQPECFGCTFDGWFDRQEGGVRLSEAESVVPSSATTNFAQWAANVYRLSYALGAGAVLGANSPTEGAYGETMAVPAPTRRGYRFAGWLVTGSLDTSIACWGATPDDMSELSGTDVICFGGEAGAVYFRDLSAVQGAFVVLSARWDEKDEFEIDDQGVLLSYNGTSASVVIPPSVTSIGASAFAGCVELEELVVPATVESIGDFAFQGSGLRRIEFMGSAPTVGVGIFRNTADELTVYVRRAAGGWTDAQTNLLPAVWPADDTDGRAIAYVTGARLTVVSAFGSPDPSTGVHEYDLGEDVTASISSPVYESDDIRHVCLGWDGTGSVPTGGNGTVVNFRADEDSSLTWNWRTDYLLSFMESENGMVSIEKGQFSFAFDTWQPSGSSVRLLALPDDGFRFDGWTGDTDGCTIDGGTITVPMSMPRRIGATFVQDVQKSVAMPVITPEDGATFDTESCTVTITCETEGATIYYSTNGSTPRQKDQFKYTQPFAITGTTTIKAVAVKDGFTQSEIATATITRVDPLPLTLAFALDESKLFAIETVGDAEWVPVEDATAVGGSSAQSGVIGMEQRTCLKATVYGKGTFSFSWKVSCEADYSGDYTYDHMTFSTVEGGRTNDMAKIDGETEWLSESVTFTTDGPHVILWTYSTDDWEEPGFEDCGWVDHVVWTGDAPLSDIVIPDVVTLPKAEVESFMAKYPSLAAQAGGDAETFAKLPSAAGKLDENGNQMYVWQDIIAGTDPTNPDDKFKIVDIKFEDGELKVMWSPDLNENGTKSVRAYTEYGRKELGGSEKWTDMKDINPDEKNDYKFRKVTVDMP